MENRQRCVDAIRFVVAAEKLARGFADVATVRINDLGVSVVEHDRGKPGVVGFKFLPAEAPPLHRAGEIGFGPEDL